MKKENRLAIIGLGYVGTALKHVCEMYYKEVFGYDIKEQQDWNSILRSDIVFICVPTPEGIAGRLDCSCVENVLAKLSNDNYIGIVAIKSTLHIGFMDKACRLHPNLRLVYNPEFLREKSAFQETVNPDRIVVSGKRQDAEEVIATCFWAENAKTIITNHRSAEIGKLVNNARIATWVSFTNEIERISEDLGADVKDVMDIVTSDRRVKSKDHLQPNLGPYSGQCIPKDLKELLNASNSEFLKAIEAVNEKTKIRYGKKPKNDETQ